MSGKTPGKQRTKKLCFKRPERRPKRPHPSFLPTQEIPLVLRNTIQFKRGVTFVFRTTDEWDIRGVTGAYMTVGGEFHLTIHTERKARRG